MIRKYGFTMVELLLVMAVIMLLAFLLLPALRTAKLKASTIKCANNMKQFSYACMEYANDNNGYVLVYCVGGDILSNWWPKKLETYLPAIKDLSCPQWNMFQTNAFNLGGYGLVISSTNVIKVSQVKIPTVKVYVADSPWYGNRWGWVIYPSLVTYSETSDQNYISLRHNKRSNFLFHDGHIESYGLDKIPAGSGSGTLEYRHLYDWTFNQ